MPELIYPRERPLGLITLVIGSLLWLALIAGTFGLALLVLALGFIVYLFAQSALIAHIKGHGVELSPTQFPDLHSDFAASCERLQIRQLPAAYVMNGHGAFNAFATQFLGRPFVVVYSDVVDAMRTHPDGLRFYFGHELGHLRMKHLWGRLLRWPALWLPLVGAAYSRARESTCDRHGAACCQSPQTAASALVALAAGRERWSQVDLASYRDQAQHSSGFWMSFHELLAGYPWTTKRVARVLDPAASMPRRNPLAYLPAAFVPYAGRLGGGFGLLVLVYVIVVLAAVALPAYQDYVAKARLAAAFVESQPARDALASYYQDNDSAPESLREAGLASRLPSGSSLNLDPERMVLTVETERGSLVFTPSLDDQERIVWACSAGDGVRPAQVPQACQ